MILKCSGDGVSHTSPHRLVGKHCIFLDCCFSTSSSSSGCTSVGSHSVLVALAAGTSRFGRVSVCHAFCGSASTAHAIPSADAHVSICHAFGGSAGTVVAIPFAGLLFCAYYASCGAPRIASCG